jgi:hypothetical protein
MEDELRLLRQAHDEQTKHILTERLVAADRIRGLELRVDQLEHDVGDANRRAALEHEQASRHVEAARGERDAAVRQFEEFQQTTTYRFVTMVRGLSRRLGLSP